MKRLRKRNARQTQHTSTRHMQAARGPQNSLDREFFARQGTGYHAAAPPSSFSRRFNTDGGGVPAKRQSHRPNT